MKALVYTGRMQSEICEVDLPDQLPGQVIVDLAFCGICGSDMHAWHGHDERRVPPLVLGHEAVGIARTGKYANKRVAINPLMTCGTCQACLGGDEHLCATRELIGMRVPGAFAQSVVISEGNLNLISDQLSFENAALAEPLACSVNAAGLAITQIEDRNAAIVILGGGAIGLLAAFVFQNQCCQNIHIAETNPHRRQMIEKLGPFQLYDPIHQKPEPTIIDIVFDAVGSGKTRAAASALVRPGGVIVHIGLQDNEAGLDTRRITLQEISFLGSYCYRRSAFSEALDLLEKGIVKADGWTDIRPLDDGQACFMDIHNGKAPPKIILDTTG